MAYEKTIWQDHITEYSNRFSETINEDGSKTLTPVPGEVIQQGTPMSAANFNKLENAIADNNTDIGNMKKIQTATGTGTAITLTGVELVDGFVISFVIALNNESVATTINGKPLYRPGTTTAPKLTAGKAATVWYDLTNDCFYLKNGTVDIDLQERVLTATIPITGWSETAPYYVAVVVTDMTDSRPSVNPIYSETLETALLEKEAWNTISYIDCTADTMTIYCFEETPTTPINVELVGG